jgi:cytochrome c peroxidase
MRGFIIRWIPSATIRVCFGTDSRIAAIALLLVAGFGAAANAESAGASALGSLGKAIFFDPTLSSSGRLACASCHSPEHAYGPPNALAVQLGGAALDRQGARAVPSLRYVLNRTPIWNKVFIADPAERLLDGDESPVGGFGWDGRFNNLREQAAFPLLAANEMANADAAEVGTKLQRAAYAAQFRQVFGESALDDPAFAYGRALIAIERFELEDPSFHPFSSKYDDYLDGKTDLTPSERHGLALFDDPKAGNCASCHPDRKGADGSHPLFTTYQFEALGVPRNREIAANAQPEYFDRGVCGPLREDQSEQQAYCGMFKTPTLRNVAARGAFFHNGRFHTLKDALRFYVQRDTNPRLWYPEAATKAGKFDDLPAGLRANVDVIDEPLTRASGAPPVWSDAEIDDVLSFLQTLTDRDAIPVSGPS